MRNLYRRILGADVIVTSRSAATIEGVKEVITGLYRSLLLLLRHDIAITVSPPPMT